MEGEVSGGEVGWMLGEWSEEEMGWVLGSGVKERWVGYWGGVEGEGSEE